MVGPDPEAPVSADDALVEALAAGELPDDDDPLTLLLAVWVRDVREPR